MDYSKRIVILSAPKNAKTDVKGVLSLEQTGKSLKGILRTYNCFCDNDATLMLKLNKTMLSPIIVLKNKFSKFNFELNNSLSISDEIAVIIFENCAKPDIILRGGDSFLKSEEEGLLNCKKEQTEKIIETKVEKEDETIEAEKEESDVIDGEMIEEFGDNSADLNEISKDSIFYKLVEGEIEKIFLTYPTEKKLCNLIENSKWAKVDYDGEQNYYAVGIITDDDDIAKYICYAVPAKSKQKPPEDIAQFCQWLPLDYENEYGDGYYIMYQNAKTGEQISLEL